MIEAQKNSRKYFTRESIYLRLIVSRVQKCQEGVKKKFSSFH